jgi:hypothetical protein
MPRCDRCGAQSQECHEIRQVGGEGLLSRYKYSGGGVIDGQRIHLCGGCHNEFLGMLQGGNKRAYSDPSLPT